ncbi:MAG: CvpA family protein [Clostridiaceae bacterium]|nr:CvpA family protein [Clostridiaceae bacterium]
MLVDCIFIAILIYFVLLGIRMGLLNMLGRLVLLFLSLGLTLLALQPLAGFLTQAPFMSQIAEWMTSPVLEPLRQTAASVDEAIGKFALPPILDQLMRAKIIDQSASVLQAEPELAAVLFRYALTAILFIVLFTLISLAIHTLTRSLTHLADALPVLGLVNRLGGTLAGLVFGLVAVLILLLLIGYAAPYWPAVAGQVAKSRLAGYFYSVNFLMDFF